MHAEFFHVGMRAPCDKGGRRILLGNNTGSRAVMQWVIGSTVLELDSN